MKIIKLKVIKIPKICYFPNCTLFLHSLRWLSCPLEAFMIKNKIIQKYFYKKKSCAAAFHATDFLVLDDCGVAKQAGIQRMTHKADWPSWNKNNAHWLELTTKQKACYRGNYVLSRDFTQINKGKVTSKQHLQEIVLQI